MGGGEREMERGVGREEGGRKGATKGKEGRREGVREGGRKWSDGRGYKYRQQVQCMHITGSYIVICTHSRVLI